MKNIFFNIWLEYIGANKKKKRKFIQKTKDYEDVVKILFLDEYIKEYLFMPKCIVILEDTFGNDLRLLPVFQNNQLFLLRE
jgi:hypothetical protein